MHRINTCKLSREGSRNYQYVTQSSGTQAFISSCSCKLGMELRVRETQYKLICYATCVDKVELV